MKYNLLLIGLILVSSFILSACTSKDQLELKVLNKIDTKVESQINELNSGASNTSPEPSVTPTLVPQTTEQLIQELNQAKDIDLDSQFKKLENELK